MTSEITIGWREQLSTETRTFSIDMTPAMDAGEALASASATLTDLLDGSSYAVGLQGSASVATTFITQTVTGLVVGHRYKLEVLGNMGGSKRSAAVLLLSVPY